MPHRKTLVPRKVHLSPSPYEPASGSPIHSSFSRRQDADSLISLNEGQKIWKRAIFKLKILSVFTQMLKDLRQSNGRYPVLTQYSENTEKRKIMKKATRILMQGHEALTTEIIPCGVIHPHSRLKGIWNIALVVILIYSALFTPFFLAFGDTLDQSALFWVESTVNGLFFMDFVINCTTAYYEKNNIIVVKRSKIICKYLKGWLIIDFLSWFPFELLLGSTGMSSKALVRFAKVPKLYRLFRVSRLVRLFNSNFQKEVLEKFQDFLNIKSSMVRLLKTFITIIISVHIFSCFWYLVAKLENFSPLTWVTRYNYQDADIPTLYITSLYWTITTLCTCGYGDISPQTKLEQALAMIWMCTGLYFFSFTISSLNSLLSSYDLKENILESKIAAIDEFASEANLSLNLRNKLKHCLKYASEKRGFSWHEKIHLIQELPKQLRYEIALNMHQGSCKALNFFSNKDQSVIALIVPLLDPIFVDKDCAVYKQGDFADEIYFLVKGNIRITLEVTIVIKSVQPGCYFGDVEVMLGYSRRFGAYSTRFCDLLIMNKNVVNELRENNLSVWYELLEVAGQRQVQYERTVIEIKEMEHTYKGALFTKPMLKRFKERVDSLLQEKLKYLNTKPEFVTPSVIAWKLDRLIKLVAKTNLNIDEIDFIKDFLEYYFLLYDYIRVFNQ